MTAAAEEREAAQEEGRGGVCPCSGLFLSQAGPRTVLYGRLVTSHGHPTRVRHGIEVGR